MARVVGIGGLFFKAKEPAKLAAWYREHLGFELEEFGSVVFCEAPPIDNSSRRDADTIWSPFPATTDYFKPRAKDFMVNFRVDDLEAMLSKLRAGGVEVADKIERSISENSPGSWIPKVIVSSSGNLRLRDRIGPDL